MTREGVYIRESGQWTVVAFAPPSSEKTFFTAETKWCVMVSGLPPPVLPPDFVSQDIDTKAVCMIGFVKKLHRSQTHSERDRPDS